jgi:outer membrane biosynthesis protein TonB
MSSALRLVAVPGRRAPAPDDAFAVFLVVALVLHLVAVRAVPRPITGGDAVRPPLEIDLVIPTPALALQPAPAPEVSAAHEAAPARARPAPSAKRAPEALTGAARAGALLHAGPATADDEPVAFVTDEDGSAFGSGVVAAGAGATSGAGPELARARLAPSGWASSPGLTPEANLSRKPRLDAADPCRGYFPAGATRDWADVSVTLVVRADGSVAGVAIVAEPQPEEGFGAAARACLLAQRFRPGLDREGRSTATSTSVRLRFRR